MEIIENDNSFKKINNDNIILKKKNLIEISKNLTKIEYLEIFNIIQEDKCQYSENKNGVFINLQNVTEKTIDKIFDFINFIKLKKEDLIKHEEYLDSARKIIEINNVDKMIENTSFSNIKENDKEKIEYELSDSEDNNKSSNYFTFSSDEDDDLENKLSLKKKKIKYTGKKLKMIKSIKDNNNDNSNKHKK